MIDSTKRIGSEKQMGEGEKGGEGREEEEEREGAGSGSFTCHNIHEYTEVRVVGPKTTRHVPSEFGRNSHQPCPTATKTDHAIGSDHIQFTLTHETPIEILDTRTSPNLWHMPPALPSYLCTSH